MDDLDALAHHIGAPGRPGPRAVAYELADDGGAAIDVTAPGPSRRDRRGITVHRARTLHRDDRARLHGIPVTSVARTLLDLAETLPPRGLERAFEEAERLRLLRPRRLEELLARSRGRRGLRPLAALCVQHREPPPPHASGFRTRQGP